MGKGGPAGAETKTVGQQGALRIEQQQPHVAGGANTHHQIHCGARYAGCRRLGVGQCKGGYFHFGAGLPHPLVQQLVAIGIEVEQAGGDEAQHKHIHRQNARGE